MENLWCYFSIDGLLSNQIALFLPVCGRTEFGKIAGDSFSPYPLPLLAHLLPSSPQARSFARLLACSLVRSRRLEKERKQLLRRLFDTQMKTAIKLMNRWIDKLKRGMLQIVTKTLNQAELVIIQCTFYELFVEYDLRSKKKNLCCVFSEL